MSYTALYRKFRPVTFDEVKGQDHIVQTLKNQINADRVGHAYLFCGTRGTGKTSVAKIFARALNCEHPLDGSPCNECEICKAIYDGSAMNIIEIDAASNNGVDNIRQIRDEIQYSPATGRYTVYIIDEVHMLSIGAFNALLKTLEEPPSYVVFILATTEPHKIPITIRSRCQRYDFKRISIDTIVLRLQELMKKEQVDVEDKAIRYIAKVADGSMRDALSLLDQCIAFLLGRELTYESVLDVLGAVDGEVFSRLTGCVIEGNTLGSIGILDEVVMQGREPVQFTSDFIWHLRSLMLLKTCGENTDLFDVSEERLKVLQKEAESVQTDIIMRYIRVLSEAIEQMKHSVNKRVLLEVALIKLGEPAMETDIASLSNRISILEQKIRKGKIVAKSKVEKKTEEREKKHEKVWDTAVPEDIQCVVDHWGQVERHIAQPYRHFLNGTRFSVKGTDTLLVVFPQDMATGFGACNKPEVIEMLNTVISGEIHKQVRVEMQLLEENQKFQDYYQEVIRHINMEIKEEEF